MLQLELQYFGYLMWRANSLEKIQMLVKDWKQRRREQQRMRQLDSITHSMDMNLSTPEESEGQETLACSSPRGHKELDMT